MTFITPVEETYESWPDDVSPTELARTYYDCLRHAVGIKRVVQEAVWDVYLGVLLELADSLDLVLDGPEASSETDPEVIKRDRRAIEILASKLPLGSGIWARREWLRKFIRALAADEELSPVDLQLCDNILALPAST